MTGWVRATTDRDRHRIKDYGMKLTYLEEHTQNHTDKKDIATSAKNWLNESISFSTQSLMCPFFNDQGTDATSAPHPHSTGKPQMLSMSADPPVGCRNRTIMHGQNTWFGCSPHKLSRSASFTPEMLIKADGQTKEPNKAGQFRWEFNCVYIKVPTVPPRSTLFPLQGSGML